MERVKITLPPQFPFHTLLSIRITDLNYGGHVGNNTFLALVHEARQQFLLAHGFTELQFAGTSLIMADAAIEFKKELHYANTVKISVAATGFDKYGFDLCYQLEVLQPGTNTYLLAGKAKTGMLCFDYQQKKLTPLPQSAIQAFTGFQQV
jgi:acyl-CoA thioesterase FadM